VDGQAADWRDLAAGRAAEVLDGADLLEADISLPAPAREALLRAAFGRGVPARLLLPGGRAVGAGQADLEVAALWRPLAAHRLMLSARKAMLWAGRLLESDDFRPAATRLRKSVLRQLSACLRTPALRPLAELVSPPGPKGLGVGEVSAAAVLRYLAHPLRFQNARDLWAYCGLGVRGGRAVGRWHSGHCEPLRAVLLSLPAGWERHRGGFWFLAHRELLPEEERRHAAACGCGRRSHPYRRAWRRVVKLWVAEVWWKWRMLAEEDLG
jgi:hypothetical protein